MKKTVSKLFALTMAVLLLVSMMPTAGAMGGYGVGGDSAGSEFVAEDNAGVFGLRISKGTDVYMIACFLVEDGNGEYILTHESVADYVDDDYDLTIMVPGGTNIPAYLAAVVDSLDMAYLYAEGMNFYNPLIFSDKPLDTTVVAGIPFANDQKTEAKRVEYKADDFSKWTQITKLLFARDGDEPDTNWLGSPIFHDTIEYKVQGIGTVYVNGAGDYIPAIMSFDDISLQPSYTLDQIRLALITADEPDPTVHTEAPAEETTEETTEDPTETTEDPDPPVPVEWGAILIVGALIAAAVALYIYSGNRKKKEAAARRAAEENQPSLYSDPILPLDPTMPTDFTLPTDPTMSVGTTGPIATHGVTRPVSNWLLRATGGPLNGKTFPISGTMKIGRSSKSDIRFPEETPGISGSHCEVIVYGDSVTLKDVGSTYGTYVNGSKLSAHTPWNLRANDSFSLAQNGVSFRLERADGSGGQPGGPAVRDVRNKVYQADASGKLTFGRNRGNTVLSGSGDKQISGNHCVLYREGGALYLKDVGSTNGTFFSEKERLQPNKPYRIRKGQAFFLSSPKYTFTVMEE